MTAKHGAGIWVKLKDEKSRHYLELNWHTPGSRFCTSYFGSEGLDHIGFIVDDVREM